MRDPLVCLAYEDAPGLTRVLAIEDAEREWRPADEPGWGVQEGAA